MHQYEICGLSRLSDVCVKSEDKGLSIIISGKAGIGNVLNIKPPMTIGEDLLGKGLDILDGVLSEVEREMRP